MPVETTRARSRKGLNGGKTKSGPHTLAIDIGGTGLKALVLDERGEKVTERVRVETPRPATPEALVAALLALVKPLPDYDRVSVGFPGVVVGGATRSAPNLDPAWKNFELRESLERRLKRPVRVLNDAGVQGFGVIDGKGVEMVITLGTGMGCALYVDGKYVPNLELAHHPFSGKYTYEEYVGKPCLREGRQEEVEQTGRTGAGADRPDLEPAEDLPRRRQREAPQNRAACARSRDGQCRRAARGHPAVGRAIEGLCFCRHDGG
jgi:polyphosphate glucokinase